MIPVSVLICTKEAQQKLSRTLESVKNFDEVIVIESSDGDHQMRDLVQSYGAKFYTYRWDGRYPKKRQWCLDHIPTRHPYIFFLDADEIVTPPLEEEMRACDFSAAGYFIKGQYIWQGQVLRYGLKNNKLCLFNRNHFEFPIIDDLDCSAMGEIEGHYQPVFKKGFEEQKIGSLRTPLLHNAQTGWNERHQRYAVWEAFMIAHHAYPRDPDGVREGMKRLFSSLPCRGLVAFCHSYFYHAGFLDGQAGFDFAKSRADYYNAVSALLSASKAQGKSAVSDTKDLAIEK